MHAGDALTHPNAPLVVDDVEPNLSGPPVFAAIVTRFYDAVSPKMNTCLRLHRRAAPDAHTFRIGLLRLVGQMDGGRALTVEWSACYGFLRSNVVPRSHSFRL